MMRRRPEPLEISASPPRPDLDMEASAPSLADYMYKIGEIVLLNDNELMHLAFLKDQGDETARNRLITANLPLVPPIARLPRYVRAGQTPLDRIQEGNLGLIRAVQKYDVRRGTRFSTYGTFWVHQSLQRAVWKSHGVALTRDQDRDIGKLRAADNTLMAELGRLPTDAEVGQWMQRTEEEVVELRAMSQSLLALEAESDDGDDSPLSLLGKVPGADGQEGLRRAIKGEQRKALRDLLGAYPADNPARRVIELRFGMDSAYWNDPLTQSEVAEELGVTIYKVRQLEEMMIRSLRVNPDLRRRLGY